MLALVERRKQPARGGVRLRGYGHLQMREVESLEQVMPSGQALVSEHCKVQSRMVHWRVALPVSGRGHSAPVPMASERLSSQLNEHLPPMQRAFVSQPGLPVVPRFSAHRRYGS